MRIEPLVTITDFGDQPARRIAATLRESAALLNQAADSLEQSTAAAASLPGAIVPPGQSGHSPSVLQLRWSPDAESDSKSLEHESLRFLQTPPGFEIRNLLRSKEREERPRSIDEVAMNFNARTGVTGWRIRGECRVLVFVKSDKNFNSCRFHEFASHGINGPGPHSPI